MREFLGGERSWWGNKRRVIRFRGYIDKLMWFCIKFGVNFYIGIILKIIIFYL